jgi:uncharacterized protein (UPF0147 family)
MLHKHGEQENTVANQQVPKNIECAEVQQKAKLLQEVEVEVQVDKLIFVLNDCC